MIALQPTCERRWLWDAERIRSEQISEDISDLLALKIGFIPEERRRALIIASCFGNTIGCDVVDAMNEVTEYSFFGRELELECAYAEAEGLMERDSP